MFLVISGTNRPGCNSLKVARVVESLVKHSGHEARLLDLQELPVDLFRPESYAEKPAGFAHYQDEVLSCDGIVVVVAEYNGSFPGVLKYFLDMLKFPESLEGTPVTFVGISAGMWGGLRAVEQLQMVFQYRFAHLYPRRVFLPAIHEAFDEAGQFKDPTLHGRLRGMVEGFVDFAGKIAD